MLEGNISPVRTPKQIDERELQWSTRERYNYDQTGSKVTESLSDTIPRIQMPCVIPNISRLLYTATTAFFFLRVLRMAFVPATPVISFGITVTSVFARDIGSNAAGNAEIVFGKMF